MSVDLQALSPAERARVIYTQARNEVSSRLWQAALGGDKDEGNRANAMLPARDGMNLTSMLTSLGGGGGHPCHCPNATPYAPIPAPLDSHTVMPKAAGTRLDLPNAIGGGALGGLGPNSRHIPALSAASARTGIPGPTLAAIVDAEAAKSTDGSWKLHSRNPRSSAAGLGQFLSGTWLDMARKEGSWLNQTAQARGWVSDRGKIQPGARGPLLALRYDAEASINATADYAKDNLRHLKKRGVELSNAPKALAHAAYLAHHLGPGDATRFLRGGLDEGRARVLLNAQVGRSSAAQFISRAGGSASVAHREWLTGYIDSRIRPERYGI